MAMIDLSPEFIRKLERAKIVSRKIFPGRFKGEHRSPKRGTSVEFADYRAYQHGDDLRHVDWNIYARSDKLFVKLFTEEESLDIVFLVDVSESMAFGEPSKLDYASSVIAALGYVGLANLDIVSVITFADSLKSRLKPLHDKRSIHKMIDFLEKVKHGGDTDFNSSFGQYARANAATAGKYGPAHQGVVVILSDFMARDGYQAGLKQLCMKQFDLHIIHLLSGEELNPSLEGEIRLEDSETGEAKEITLNEQILEEYQQRLEKFCQNLRSFCMKNGITYNRAITNIPVEELVLKELRRSVII